MIVQNLYEKKELHAVAPVMLVMADGEIEQKNSSITVEHGLEIYVQDQLAFKLVCTPDHLVELVLGRLLSEGYIQAEDDVDYIYICEQGLRAKVFLNHPITMKSDIQTEPTCCTANKKLLVREGMEELKPLQRAEYRQEWIFALAEEFAHGSIIHKKTRGTHSCYLMCHGTVVFAAEDIGRHNALDKALGYMVMQHYKKEDCILFTTGRVPTDMVEKVIRAKVPILVSKAVPTDEAIDLARAYHLTLICKAWPDSYELFC